jgi:hypothetical protein
MWADPCAAAWVRDREDGAAQGLLHQCYPAAAVKKTAVTLTLTLLKRSYNPVGTGPLRSQAWPGFWGQAKVENGARVV